MSQLDFAQGSCSGPCGSAIVSTFKGTFLDPYFYFGIRNSIQDDSGGTTLLICLLIDEDSHLPGSNRFGSGWD
jgi:hypothetical protein